MGDVHVGLPPRERPNIFSNVRLPSLFTEFKPESGAQVLPVLSFTHFKIKRNPE